MKMLPSPWDDKHNFTTYFLQIRGNEKSMDELRQSNQALQDRLEGMYRSLSLSPGGGASSGANVSLMNEMELSDSERSLNASRRPFSQIDEEEAQDEIECDNPEGILGAVGAKGEVKEVRRDRDK